jgi:hypothetical protein
LQPALHFILLRSIHAIPIGCLTDSQDVQPATSTTLQSPAKYQGLLTLLCAAADRVAPPVRAHMIAAPESAFPHVLHICLSHFEQHRSVNPAASKHRSVQLRQEDSLNNITA